MGIFDLIKNPDLAERTVASEVLQSTPVPVAEPPDPEVALPVEIQGLRQRAREVDAQQQRLNSARRQVPMDPSALEFLTRCLEAAAAASEVLPSVSPDISDESYDTILRTCSVPLVSGDWATVLAYTDEGAAVAAELRRRKYADPVYRFSYQEGEWTLSVNFGF